MCFHPPYMSKHWFIAFLIKKYTKNKKLGLDIGIGYDLIGIVKRSNLQHILVRIP